MLPVNSGVSLSELWIFQVFSARVVMFDLTLRITWQKRTSKTWGNQKGQNKGF
jgi:hypothetical protein